MRLKNYSQLAAGLFYALTSFVIVRYMLHFIHEPDIWWHLAHGRLMLQQHVFVRTDLFSHTLAGTSWINFEWLSEILFYMSYALGGIDGVYWLKVILGLSAVAWPALLAWRLGARGPLHIFLLWFGYHLLQARLCTRIELTTLNLMGIFALLVSQLAETEQRFIPWVLAALMVLWCNLHAGFIYGIALLICFSIGARWAQKRKRAVALIDRSLLLCLAAVLINPYGPFLTKIFIINLHNFGRTSPRFIEEWASPTLENAVYFWVSAVGTAGILVFAVLRKRKELLLWAPALALFSIYGISYFRTTALLTFVFVPAAAIVFRGREKRVWWALCLLPLIIDWKFFTHPPMPGKIESSVYPIGSCRYVQEHNIQGRMHNPFAYGGFIDWTLGPSHPVFSDGRYIFFPLMAQEQQFLSSAGTAFSETTWKNYFDQYHVDYAIERYDKFAFKNADEFYRFRSILTFQFPKKTWALVYWDDTSLVFLKRGPKFDKLIKTDEYRAIEPYQIGHTIVLSRKDPVLKKQVLEEAGRNVREVGVTGRNKQLVITLE